MNIYRYGAQVPVYFKLTLNGEGVAGLTLASDDVKLSKDGAAFTNIGLVCAGIGNGLYAWTPAATSNTQCKTFCINIKDVTGGAFDENCLIYATGGDPLAQLNGV